MATSICTGLKSQIVGLRETTEKKSTAPRRLMLFASASSPIESTDLVDGAMSFWFWIATKELFELRLGQLIDVLFEERFLDGGPAFRRLDQILDHAFVNAGKTLLEPRGDFHSPEKVGVRDELAELHRMRMRLGRFGNFRNRRAHALDRRRLEVGLAFPVRDRDTIMKREVRIHERRAVEITQEPRVAVELDAPVDQKLDRSAVRAVPIDGLSSLITPLLFLMSTSTVQLTALRMSLVLVITRRPVALVSCAQVVAAEMPIPCWPREQRPRPNLEEARYSPKTFGTSSAVDARAVVLDPDQDLIGVLERARALLFDRHADLGQDLVVLAGIQGVIHRLFQSGQNRLGCRRETDLLEVLGEILGGAAGRDLLWCLIAACCFCHGPD